MNRLVNSLVVGVCGLALVWCSGCQFGTSATDVEGGDSPQTSLNTPADDTKSKPPQTLDEYAAQRKRLDETVWAKEVDAQRHEKALVDLWDRLNTNDDPGYLLGRLNFQEMIVGDAGEPELLELGIRRIKFGKPENRMEAFDWKKLVDEYRLQGYTLVESEWHHAAFTPADRFGLAKSVVNVVLHVAREEPAHRMIVRANLHVTWTSQTDLGKRHLPVSIEVHDCVVLERKAPPAFREVLTVETDESHSRLLPLLAHDLNRDGLVEVFSGGLNRVYWNHSWVEDISPAELPFEDTEEKEQPNNSEKEGEAEQPGESESKTDTADPPTSAGDVIENVLVDDDSPSGPADPSSEAPEESDPEETATPLVALKSRAIVEFQPLDWLPSDFAMWDSAIFADFNGDGFEDLVCVGADRYPMLLAGEPRGKFAAARRCCDFRFTFPKSFTAGDIDGDGDLDLFVGQYKKAYQGGSMPTPYYNANDGHPFVLLRNDGEGNFVDDTESAGLTSKRNRRVYSSSLVDLDDDADLDLLVVADFAGVDVYTNDGNGRFTDVTNQWFAQPRLFGMAHTLADFDFDSRLDIFAIGMSSTTARRLDRLGLGRKEFAAADKQRPAMSYGNRMFLAATPGDESDDERESGGEDAEPNPESKFPFQQPAWSDDIARTGWSWGVTSPDFDLDGDPDLYIANGHHSGESVRDYCTQFWRHDLYEGTSVNNAELKQLFDLSQVEIGRGAMSWNGYEHNALFLNRRDEFVNVAFLFGVSFEADSRAVIGTDIDADGRPDLIVSEYETRPDRPAVHRLRVLRNELDSAGHWIGVRLYGDAAGSPIGAKIIMRAGGIDQVRHIVTGDSFSCQHAPIVQFGLSQLTAVESLEVVWPTGQRQKLEKPQIDRYYVAAPSAEQLAAAPVPQAEKRPAEPAAD